MSAAEAGHHPMTAEERRVVFASSLGTVFEWYDFYLYGSLAAIIAKHFFAGVNETTSFIFALLAFAAGFAVRPFGAIVFGRVGDMIGRKYTFLITIVIMGLSTALVGLLPSYASIGVVAPIVLITLRLLQGLALGGEYGGAATYVAEHAPKGRRGFFTAWIQTTATLGLFLSLLVIMACRTLMGNEVFEDWGWRVPFLLSVLLIALGLYIRLNIHETPSFKAVENKGAQVKVPLLEVFRKYWKQVILGGVAAMSTGTSYNLIVAFGLTYGTQTLGFSRGEMLSVVLVACAACIVMLPVFGALSDRFGRKPIIIGGIIAEALVAFPMFWLMDTKELGLVFAGYLLMMTAFAANYGPIATFLAELFGTRVRYSGLSISYMLCGLLGSAATPLVTTALLSLTGKGSSIAWYMVASAIVSLIALLLLTETFKRDIDHARQ